MRNTRRMFGSMITSTDKFLALSTDAKLLYFQLMMATDDEGFITNAKSVLVLNKIKEDTIAELALNDYIIVFKSDVVVIVDWLNQNHIHKGRVTPTQCTSEKKSLEIIQERYVVRNKRKQN